MLPIQTNVVICPSVHKTGMYLVIFPSCFNIVSAPFQVRVAYQPYYVTDYTKLASQKSAALFLEEGKP